MFLFTAFIILVSSQWGPGGAGAGMFHPPGFEQPETEMETEFEGGYHPAMHGGMHPAMHPGNSEYEHPEYEHPEFEHPGNSEYEHPEMEGGHPMNGGFPGFHFPMNFPGFGGNMGGGGMAGGNMGGGGGMPIIPNTMYFECEGIPPQMCNLQMTRGQCVGLPSQKKCDIAEKCNGRAQRDCSKYWTGTLQAPNCVWLQQPGQPGKCDEASKCQGRSQKLCTNPMFPPCRWMPNPMMPGAGMCVGARLQETHEEFPETHEKLQKTHVEEEKAETVVPAENKSNNDPSLPLIAAACASFLVGLGFTFLIVKCKNEQPSELKESLGLDRRI